MRITLKMVRAVIVLLLAGSLNLCSCEYFQPLLYPGENFRQPFISYGERELESLNSTQGVLVAASIDENGEEKVPIFSIFEEGCTPASSCYEFKQYAFDSQNYPKWSNFSKNYYTPEFHFIPEVNKTLLYFSAVDVSTNRYAVGYVHLGSENCMETSKTIISKPERDYFAATLLKDEDKFKKSVKLYLYYTDGSHIYGVRLNNEGTGMYENTCPDLLIEGGTYGRPTVLKRNPYYFIFYQTPGVEEISRPDQEEINRRRYNYNFNENEVPKIIVRPGVPATLGIKKSLKPLFFDSEEKTIKELCPRNLNWGNCSISRGELQFHLACEVEYQNSYGDDMPKRPGTALVGWLTSGWPYIHPKGKEGSTNLCQ